MGNFKEQCMGFISHMKIRHKILILSVLILIIPCILFAYLSTEYYQKIQIENKKHVVENELEDTYKQFNNTLEICNMTMQTMLLNGRVEKFVDVLINDKQLSAQELINFNNTEIRAVERLVNTNPYIYSIRFYIDAPILEMAPVIYNIGRFQEGKSVYHTDVTAWYFNQKDVISPLQRSSPYPELLATLISPYTNMKGASIGLIEIATPMRLLFPQMYETTEEKIMYFVDKEGVMHKNEGEAHKKWDNYIKEMTSYIKDESGVEVINIQGEPMIIGYRFVKSLEGYMVVAHSFQKVENQITEIRTLVIGILIILVAIITCLINMSTKVVFRNFYKVLDAIQEIQKGNLDIALENFGKGEVGELGSHVQKMANDIKCLMVDQVSKGILVKDSQIKALQNQINAHFIYNVLESIKMMAEIEGLFDISDAITHLGKLLRYSMRWHSPKVKVKEELDYIGNYMALLNLRYDYAVELNIDMPEEILEQEIPKMCIQPIVENAMKHGIEDVAEDTTLYIKGKLLEDAFTIEVTDFGVGMNKEQVETLTNHSSNGIGLRNVQERIQMCFGQEYGLEISSKEGCFTKVTIKIPYNSCIGGEDENITHSRG